MRRGLRSTGPCLVGPQGESAGDYWRGATQEFGAQHLSQNRRRKISRQSKAPSGRKKAGSDLQADALRLQGGLASDAGFAGRLPARQMAIAGHQTAPWQHRNVLRRLRRRFCQHRQFGCLRARLALRLGPPLMARLGTGTARGRRARRTRVRTTCSAIHWRKLAHHATRKSGREHQQEHEHVGKKVHRTRYCSAPRPIVQQPLKRRRRAVRSSNREKGASDNGPAESFWPRGVSNPWHA